MSKFKLPHDHGEDHIDYLHPQLESGSNFQQVAQIFRQLSDPTRIKIFWILCHHEECVINLSALMEMSSPAISHHLKTLKDQGLITSRREGKEVYYYVGDTEECTLLHQMIEQIMEMKCPMDEEQLRLSMEERVTSYPEDQLEIVRKIHHHLSTHLSTRYTIDSLAKEYLINPTTLKEIFRAMYGNSIAAHIKEHRMEKASSLLINTKKTIGDIAAMVGYSSQSKFTSAFKAYYQETPKAYRKNHPLDKGNE